MNLILLVSVVPFLIIFILNWFLPYITPKSIQFGVRIPRERESEPEILAVRQRYHIRLIFGSVIIVSVSYPVAIVTGVYTLALLSPVFELLFVHINYFVSFRKLHSIKLKEGWFDGLTENYGAVYLNGTSIRHRITGAYFILPAVVLIATVLLIGVTTYPHLPSSVPTHFSLNGAPTRFSPKTVFHVFPVTFIQVVITTVLFIVGWVLTRTATEIDVSRPYTTYEQQTRFKSYYRDLLYVFATFIGMTLLFVSMRILDYPSFVLSTPLIVIPLALGYLLIITSPYLLGQMGSRLQISGSATEDTGISNVDDDGHWKLGMFYFNRQDPSILVGRRFGIGWTLNFGNPRSWIVIGMIIVVVSVAVTFYLVLH